MIEVIIVSLSIYGFYGLVLSQLVFSMFPSLDVPGPIGVVYFFTVWAACTAFTFVVTVIAALVNYIRRNP